MASKTKVSKGDIQKGYKRVNITLSIQEFDLLSICAEFDSIEHTTKAKSILMKEVNKEAKRIIEKEKYIPKSQRGIKAI